MYNLRKDWEKLDKARELLEDGLIDWLEDELSIDRIDINGDYEPNNCRWATDNEQARNTSTNKIFTINNESKSLIEWCEIYNINYRTVQDRLNRDWDIIDALTKPVETKFSKGGGM